MQRNAVRLNPRPDSTAQATVRSDRALWVLIGLVAISATLFFVTGRFHRTGGDLAPVYGSVRCFVSGCNPYVFSDVQNQIIVNGENPARFVSTYWQTHSLLYPPLSYLMLAPLAFVHFPVAAELYFWISGLLFAGACFIVVYLSPPQARLIVAVATSAVLVTSGVLLRLGQVSTIAIAFTIAGALYLRRRESRIAGAVLLCIAAGLKPQLAVPFMIFFLLNRSTRKAALGSLAGFGFASIAAAGLLSLRLHSIEWIGDFRHQLEFGVSTGTSQKIDTGIVNLTALTGLLSASRFWYESIDIAVFLAIGATLLIAYSRSQESEERDWIALAALSFFTLIVTYHRTYDMRIQILAFPALGLIWRQSRKMAAFLTVCSILLLFSSAVVLENWGVHHLKGAVIHSLLFRLLVERQQAVAVLLTVVGWTFVLLGLQRRSGLNQADKRTI